MKTVAMEISGRKKAKIRQIHLFAQLNTVKAYNRGRIVVGNVDVLFE